MALQEKQLGQLRPANTTAASIYSPAISTTAIIKTIVVCCTSTSSGAKQFRIFLDDDGTTYDESTALYYDVNISNRETVTINTFIAMDDSSGNLAVRTDTADALTFTVFGAEIT